MPRLTLYVYALDASSAAHVTDAAHAPRCTVHFAYGKPPTLSAPKFVPSLSLRGLPASWHSLSQRRHMALCRASLVCVRSVCAVLGGRQRLCGMQFAGDNRKSLRSKEGDQQ
jgi:hypothetical protein